MREFVLLVAFVTCINWTKTSDCDLQREELKQADYYWRDYFGVVPKDAVDGGFSETGNTTYVGQMASQIHVGIYPVNIYAGSKEAIGAINHKVVDGTYVKILCSGRNKHFEWKNVNVDDMHLLTDYHLVIGGVQSTAVTYVGRANFEGQVQIGRIHPSAFPNIKGLWLYNKEGNQVNFKTFEILVLPR